jgi:hypothetical protein
LIVSTRLLPVLAMALMPFEALADAPTRVESRDQFVELVRDRALQLTGLAGIAGVTLFVSPSGKIEGKASGAPVRGEWTWRDGFFCRTLYWGERDLGLNCQVVERRGGRLRFIADRGAGQHADFRLR